MLTSAPPGAMLASPIMRGDGGGMGGRDATPIVGRQRALAGLLDAFARGQQGTPRVVVLHGDAGMGKTRLVDEFRRRIAGDHPVPVVFGLGQCIELGEVGTPFAPIRRMVRALAAAVGVEVAGDVGADAILDLIEHVIEDLSASRHLVLVVEDLHWADAATLALLRTLTATLRARHLTVVLTHRTHHLDRTHPVAALLADLEHSRPARAIPVEPLSEEESATLVRHLRPDASPATCASIVARSQGVPFFIEELAALGTADLTEGLRALVLTRYRRLGSPARAVVDLLAAGGLRVDHETLCAVHPGDVHELDAALREAIDAHVVVVDGDTYAFRHGLIRQAVHDDLLRSVRTDLHRAYAGEAERRVAAGDEAAAHAAAEHWLAAGETARAFDATIVARQQALRSLAWSTAARLGERLIDLWPRVSRPAARVALSRAELGSAVVDHWSGAGDQERALDVARSVARCTPDHEDPVGAASLSLAVARPLLLRGRRAEAVAASRRALDLLGGVPDGSARALRVRAHGTCDLFTAWATLDEGDLAGALDKVRAVLTTLDALPVLGLTGRLCEVEALVRLGHTAEAVVVGTAAMRSAAEHGRARSHGTRFAVQLARAHIAAGRPDEALRLLEQARPGLSHSPVLGVAAARVVGELRAWNDEPDAAASQRPTPDLLAQVWSENPDERAAWAVADAESALLAAMSADGLPHRRALLDRALAAVVHLASAPATRWPGLRRDLVLPAAWALADGTLAGADEALRLAVASALKHALTHLPDDPARPAILAIAAAEANRAADVHDVDGWGDVVASVTAGRLPVRALHWARFRLAEALVHAGEGAEASDLLEAIAAEAPRQGVAVVGRWARDLRARVPLRSGRPAPNPLATLTPRELEVLALVAEGLTNPQIGRQLNMAAKTASVHVSAILAKLGAATRTQAAGLYVAARPAPLA